MSASDKKVIESRRHGRLFFHSCWQDDCCPLCVLFPGIRSGNPEDTADCCEAPCNPASRSDQDWGYFSKDEGGKEKV